MDKSGVLKYAAIYGPMLTLVCMVGGWVYHVETGLSRANDVTLIRDAMAGLNKDLGYQRGRIANLEQLFEPYLIQKKVEEEMRKRDMPIAPPVPPVPKAVKEDAKNWAHSQLNRMPMPRAEK